MPNCRTTGKLRRTKTRSKSTYGGFSNASSRGLTNNRKPTHRRRNGKIITTRSIQYITDPEGCNIFDKDNNKIGTRPNNTIIRRPHYFIDNKYNKPKKEEI